MRLGTLSRRSLRFYARAHLGAILGAAVSAAVLVGALIVGDSVRGSLREMALARLGKVQQAMATGDRMFTTSFATNFEESAAVLNLAATAVNSEGSARANRVQALGVAKDFWRLATQPRDLDVPPDGAFLNEALARQLQVSTNDSILLRVQKPSALSLDAPLAKGEDQTAALRLNVDRILSDEEFGRFGLAASQIAPFNAFVNRESLSRRVGVTNKANLLLWAAEKTIGGSVLGRRLKAADVEVEFRSTAEGKQTELRTSRVFIDPAVEEAALAVGKNPAPILTYFVNRLALAGGNGEPAKAGTPYSMVTAIGNDLRDDEIRINSWCAEDLGAKVGDELELTYFVVGPMRKLVEESAKFRVKEIVPMAGVYGDRTLMPDFPGMTDKANCRDWDTGFPIKTDAIREKDEKYWDDYRGTPKAFINLARGQKLWANRFGKLTAVRWPAGQNVEAEFLAKLDPETVGLKFEPVRAQALAASSQGQDFGELFLSFSFFLIVAALMLMTLLFGFSIEQRAVEMGTLLAIGLSPKQVRRLLFFEGAGLAVVGTVVGLIGGIVYAKAMLAGLSTIWKSAVGTSALHAHVLPMTVMIGAGASVLVAVGTLAWALRKEGKKPARELLAGASEEAERVRGKKGIAKIVMWVGVVGAVALMASGFKGMNSETFFGAGALLLMGGIAAAAVWMRKQNETEMVALPSLRALGLRNIARRRKRSRAVLILLGSGAFIIASIGAFRLDAASGAGDKKSGTGGFAFVAESAQPIVHDLNSREGRDAYGIQGTNANWIPFRVRAGDDASCLNLNKAQKPRLLGVNPALLEGRFSFGKGQEWKLLESAEAGVVPAIGDANSIQWALKAKIGDTIDYEDERGRPFKVRLVGAIANSILQGNLIISEKHFVERFPTEAGYRMFLIDAPSKDADEVGRELTRALQDYGLELTRASERLAQFNAVQNTYINTFQVLGGLGLLLGSFGLGVVVLRNVFERRGELALLQAVGFAPKRVRNLILGEHAALMAAGLMIGAGAAILAVLPQLLQARTGLPLVSLAATLGGVVVFGLAATWFATSLALRGNLLDSLRSE